MRSKLYSKTAQRLLDALIFATAWVIAYFIRFGGVPPAGAFRQMALLVVPLAAAQIGTNLLLGVYRYQWRYFQAEDVIYIVRAHVPVCALLLLMRVTLGGKSELFYIRLGIIAVVGFLSATGAVGVRLARRLVYERETEVIAAGTKRRFLLIGAGSHGATVAREMLLRKGIEVVGFVDDDPRKRGAIIAGLSVLGRTADLPQLVVAHHVDEILVCVSPKSRHRLRLGDVNNGNGLGVLSRIVPTLEELLGTAVVEPAAPAFTRLPPTPVNEPPGTEGDALQRTLGAAVHRTHARGDGQSAYPQRERAAAGNGDGLVAPAPLHPAVIPAQTPRRKASVPVQNKTILITGGAGFIGSSLAERLADCNDVVLLDQRFEDTPIQYTDLLRHPNVSAIRGDIVNSDLRALVKQADIVVHAAAILGVNRVCSSGRETLETNYVGTSRLLKALDASSTIERFVYFSSSEVFGVNSYRVDEASPPSVGPIAESRWSYAMSKLAGEHLVASYFRETGLPISIVRPFNIFGPRRTGDYALGQFILSALDGEPLQIHGDGMQIRSWCYIEDFCSALLQMMVRPEAIGEDFNIGHPGNTVTVYELAQKVIQLTGSTSLVTFCEPPFPDISIRVPSLQKARRLLGYEPQYALNTGLKLTIQWHRENFEVLQPRLARAMGDQGQLAA